MNKKRIMTLLLLASCSVCMIAQTNYYYYRGKKIPITESNDNVCVSISKNRGKTDESVIRDVDVSDRIEDSEYDIYVVKRSDLRKITDSDAWNDESMRVTPSYKTIEGTEVFSTPYINVRLKKEQDISILTSYAKMYGMRIVQKDPFLPLWYILSVLPENRYNALDCANLLYESGDFAESVPDLCSDDIMCSNDPMFSQQWGLYNSSNADIDISICPAWNYATGRNVKIAILDQGVDMDHIDLSSNISNLSFDTETGTSPSLFYGDHATHCAGIAAAVKDNGIQIAGVAPEAKIVSISNSLSSTTNSRLKRADGIVWAYQNGIDVISNSWGSSTHHAAIDEAIQDAFKYGRQGKGCVITFSSGNGGSSNIGYPANCNDTILAVGAINSNGTRAYFSNYGTGLSIVAPGVNILSTLPNNQTGFYDGTSMACPHVAGVAALILERNPELTVSQVNSLIKRNAKKLSGVNFNISTPDGTWNNEYGYGLVDAYNSVINTPSVIYIQNEIVTGDRTYSADSIYIGKDVTDRKEYGNVILGQGNITLNGNFVKIKNSTSIPLGTTLNIGQ